MIAWRSGVGGGGGANLTDGHYLNTVRVLVVEGVVVNVM